MAKAKSPGPPAKLALYEKLVAMFPDVERKGAKMPYTSVNGHMFSFLDPTGSMSLRLPAEELEAFLKKYKTKLSEQYGAVMKEYAVVPAALLKKTDELSKHFQVSYDYVSSLKPKPTTRKKTAKKKSAKMAKKKVVKKAKKKAVKKKRT